MKQKQCGKKIIFVTAAVILCVFAGLFLLQRKEPSTKGQGDKIYRSLSKDDRQVADVYAALYETDKEEVARIQKKTNDWEKTNKQLEKEFFTIDENIKYQMQKEGYRLEDLEKAEKLSVQTGKKSDGTDSGKRKSLGQSEVVRCGKERGTAGGRNDRGSEIKKT